MLKRIYTKILQVLPQALAEAINARRQRADQKKEEVERLDRIRNPSKYRGKEI